MPTTDDHFGDQPASPRQGGTAGTVSGRRPAGPTPSGCGGATMAVLLGACAALAVSPAPAWAVTLERVSVGPGGVQADSDSFLPVISPDGRYVAFGSSATNLVPGDTNRAQDVFLRDRQAGETERVSLGQGDVEGNAISYGVTMSADGRLLAFASYATNLVPGDTNGLIDLFVRDRRTHRTERVNVATGGAQANIALDVPADAPVIAAGGRFVAFDSFATNLVPGDTNGVNDVFVRDRAAGTTERVSLGAGGAQADAASYWPSISADGRFVAFVSYAQNLAPGSAAALSNIYLRDRMTGTTTLVPRTGYASGPLLSADGSILAFSTVSDHVFVYDRRTGGVRQVDLTPSRGQANGSSFLAALAPGGLNVGFISDASDLVPGDTNRHIDIFVRAR